MKNNNLTDLRFVRKFSTALFKNKRLPLGEAEFSKDFLSTDRGDKYPLLFSSGEYSERIENGEYIFSSESGFAARLLGHLSPYAVYEAMLTELDGACGFVFVRGDDRAIITLGKESGGTLFACCGEEKIGTSIPFAPGLAFSVQPRKNRFDVYVKTGKFPVCLGTFDVPAFEKGADEEFFMSCSAGLYCEGEVTVREASFFMDSGVSQADIRTVRYENGEVLTENGKIFLTVSVRLEEGCYQGVFSWIPGTEVFGLTGALFFDAGDGEWGNDVASSLIYDRNRGKWLLWVCSFSHGHVLAHAEFDGEPRYGKNVIDVTLVPALQPGEDDTVFGGKSGDEDPDLFYDEERGKWLLSVCRVSSEGGYRYYFFESDEPFEGFVCVGSGIKGAETGGSFLKYNNTLYFVCGNSFEARSDYRVYPYGEFSSPGRLTADFPDGGFRGWGTVFRVKQGTREKLYWLTFDRHKGSGWNWSYGNLYCFEAIIT